MNRIGGSDWINLLPAQGCESLAGHVPGSSLDLRLVTNHHRMPGKHRRFRAGPTTEAPGIHKTSTYLIPRLTQSGRAFVPPLQMRIICRVSRKSIPVDRDTSASRFEPLADTSLPLCSTIYAYRRQNAQRANQRHSSRYQSDKLADCRGRRSSAAELAPFAFRS